MARQKKDVDWVKLEADYRANIKSIRMLEDEYGISKTRIGQIAKENDWTRDTSAKIKARTQAKLDASLLDSKLDGSRVSEKEVIEAAAETQTNVILAHRKDIGRARKLALSLLEELEGVTDNPEFIKHLAETMYSQLEGEVGQKAADKLMEAFRKASSLPGRVGTMKMLSETLKNLVGLEREAFGIESKTPIDDALKASGIQVSFVAANGPK